MSTRTRVHLLSLLTVFLWGSAFPLTKIALESFASHQLSFLRCLVAALALLLGVFPNPLTDWLAALAGTNL